jgi:hypothetical protein
VVVTKADYDELEKRLKQQHPDRDLPEYDGALHDVRSIKRDVLHLATPADDNKDQGGDLAARNEDGFETNSLFPFKLRFLDLSTLRFNVVPERLPSPLFIRDEYDEITKRIEGDSIPKNKLGSVVISGQPGTGEVLQLPPYLAGSNQLANIKARPRICTLESSAP